MDICLAFPCGNLSLWLQDSWIVDEYLNEPLLERPILKCIYFDLDRVLTENFKQEMELVLALAIENGGNEKELRKKISMVQAMQFDDADKTQLTCLPRMFVLMSMKKVK